MVQVTQCQMEVELAFTVVPARAAMLLRQVAALKAVAMTAQTHTAMTTVAHRTNHPRHCQHAMQTRLSLRTRRQANATHHLLVPVVVFIDLLRASSFHLQNYSFLCDHLRTSSHSHQFSSFSYYYLCTALYIYDNFEPES